MWKLIIFDLDNTLIHSDHLEEYRGAANLNDESRSYKRKLLSALSGDLRVLISSDTLEEIRDKYPDAKLAVFTTAPRFYAETVLEHVYPDIEWDAVVGFEDVAHTKPNPEGIVKVMGDLGLDDEDAHTVILIGDSEKDIKAAYQAGVWAMLFRAGWPRSLANEHWRALHQMADLETANEADLLAQLDDPIEHLWCFEAHLAGDTEEPNAQFDRLYRVRKFSQAEGDQGKSCQVFVAGRLFSDYSALDDRRSWHGLTHLIHEIKEDTDPPEVLVSATRIAIKKAFMKQHPNAFFLSPANRRIVVTCVPRKPGRPRRLERVVEALQEADDETPLFPRATTVFDPDVFRFTEGVQSHHGAHLGAAARFANVRDHLELMKPAVVNGAFVVVLDDVVTTGSTLYYSELRALEAGAKGVVLIAFAQAIGV